jgi:hypothetical protein
VTAAAFFDGARALKRELTGKPAIGLTESEVAGFNAVIDKWTATATQNPTALRDATAFFASVRGSFGPLSTDQVAGIERLLQAYGTASWPVAYAAYGLATAWRETGKRMQPVREKGMGDRDHDGEDDWFEKYDTGKLAGRLGNTSNKDNDGQLFCGRGDVQVTGHRNYVLADTALGLNGDLLKNPSLALKPDISARIMVWGMETGAFTGKKLADYLPAHGDANERQLTLCRYVINGQDAAGEIADNALKFQVGLNAGGWA